MSDMSRAVILRYLLTLANNEMIQTEESKPEEVNNLKNDLAKVIAKIDNIYFAGPSGFNPVPTYEKCEKCGNYRLKK